MLKCAQCSTAIDLGREVLGVQLGVVGPNGFVQLEDMGQLDHVGIVEVLASTRFVTDEDQFF